MNTLLSDIKRALTSWGFIAGLAGTCAALFFGSIDTILPALQAGTQGGNMAGFHEQVLFGGLASNVMLFCAPILAALPYTAAFVEEYKSGYLKESLPRAGIRPYIRGKVFATGISGGLALFAGIILAYIAFALLFTPIEIAPPPVDASSMDKAMAVSSEMQAAQPSMFMQIIGRGFLFFLSGFFWSVVGALFAVITMSRYLAYAFPFILYYVLVMLCQRYFTGLFILNPQEWLNPVSSWPGGTWGISLFLGEIILIVSVCYAVSIRKRLAKSTKSPKGFRVFGKAGRET